MTQDNVPHKLYIKTKSLFDEVKSTTNALESASSPPQLEAFRVEVAAQRSALKDSHVEKRIVFKKHIAQLRKAFEKELDDEQRALDKEIITRRKALQKSLQPSRVIKQRIKLLEKEIRKNLKIMGFSDFKELENYVQGDSK